MCYESASDLATVGGIERSSRIFANTFTNTNIKDAIVQKEEILQNERFYIQKKIYIGADTQFSSHYV